MAFWNYGLFYSRSRTIRRASTRRSTLLLQLERLEDRTMPSADLLSASLLPVEGPQTGSAAPEPAGPAVLNPDLVESFLGLGFTDTSGFVPPDTHAAAGPDHIVEVVNAELGIYSKTGTLLFQEDLNTFFASASPSRPGALAPPSRSAFDPVVAYDELAGRFIVAGLEVDFDTEVAYLLYAVSNTSNPLDGFTEMHRIAVDEFSDALGQNVWGDYPKVGWNADVHVFTLNMFGFSSGFSHVSVITIDKSTVLDANPATLTKSDINRSNSFTMAAATMHGAVPGDPMWFVEEAGYGNGTTIRVVKMTDVLSATPTFTEFDLGVDSYLAPPSAEQPGGTGVIQTNDTRVLNAEWRDNRLVAAQAVGISADSDAHARWYEFDTSGAAPTLTQQGTIDPGAGVDTFFPSIAIAASGDLGMTFIQSSATEFMSMYVTGQTAAEGAGVMILPELVKAGEAYYTAFDGSPFRAGDYSGITVDPVTDTFWAANEYATAAASENWGTWIANFNLTHTPFITEHVPETSLEPVSSIDFTFSQAMDNTSFATADDIVSFIGPNGDLLGEVTDFSWLNSTTLRVIFNSQATPGTYTMVIGPQILSDPDGVAMNQDHDGTPGESLDDQYTATFAILGTIFVADFSDPNSAANLDGFTVDNSAGGLWHLSTGRGDEGGHSRNDSMYYGQDEAAGDPAPNYDTGARNAGSITSPEIDLTSATVAMLSFAYFLETENFSPYDAASVLISQDGGAYTEIAANHGGPILDPTTGWNTLVLDLTAYVGSAIQIRFAFDTVDDFANNFEGWYVDDVEVLADVSLQQTLTWDGGGADDNWTTAENWAGDAAPVAGDAVVFAAGAAQLTNNNNFAAGTQFESITFNGDGYNITGNAVTLSAGLINTVGTNVLDLPITLDGPQTFSAVASTTLQVDGTVNNAGSLLTMDSAGTVILNDVISGSGGLTKTGAGTLVLAGNNTYTGPTILDAGTLAVGSNTAIGTGTLTLSDGTTLKADGAARTLTNAVTLGGNVTIGGALNLTLSGAATLTGSRTLTVTNTGLTTLSGVISQSGGTWSLTKAGTGQLVLTKSNTYAGGTILSAGVLAVGNNGAVGTGTLTLNAGTLRASGAARTLTNVLTLGGNFTIGGTFDLTLSGAATLTGNRTLTVANTALTTLSGVIGQSGGTWRLTKAGAGTLLLSNSNTYAGGTTLSAGTLAVGNNGAVGTGRLTLIGGTLTASGAARTLTNLVTLGGNVTIGGTLGLTLSGATTLTGNRTLTVTNTGLTTLSGVISQSGGTWSLTKAGTGTLVLTRNNTYAGGTILSAGVLAVGNNGAVGTGTLTLNAGTLRANGAARTLTNAVTLGGNVTIGGSLALTLSGAATLTGSRTLTVANTALTTLSGAIGQSAAGFGITKAGAGKLVLSGANTYSGATTINNGTLIVNGTQTSSNVTVKTGAILGGAGSVGNVTVQAGGKLSPGSSPAILQTSTLAFNSGSTFVAELNGTTVNTEYDQVSVTGTVNLGSSALSVVLGFTPTVGDSFIIITNDGLFDAVSGTFSGLAEGASISQDGVVLQITYFGGTGNDVVLTRIA